MPAGFIIIAGNNIINDSIAPTKDGFNMPIISDAGHVHR